MLDLPLLCLSSPCCCRSPRASPLGHSIGRSSSVSPPHDRASWHREPDDDSVQHREPAAGYPHTGLWYAIWSAAKYPWVLQEQAWDLWTEVLIQTQTWCWVIWHYLVFALLCGGEETSGQRKPSPGRATGGFCQRLSMLVHVVHVVLGARKYGRDAECGEKRVLCYISTTAWPSG